MFVSIQRTRKVLKNAHRQGLDSNQFFHFVSVCLVLIAFARCKAFLAPSNEKSWMRSPSSNMLLWRLEMTAMSQARVVHSMWLPRRQVRDWSGLSGGIVGFNRETDWKVLFTSKASLTCLTMCANPVNIICCSASRRHPVNPIRFDRHMDGERGEQRVSVNCVKTCC